MSAMAVEPRAAADAPTRVVLFTDALSGAEISSARALRPPPRARGADPAARARSADVENNRPRASDPRFASLRGERGRRIAPTPPRGPAPAAGLGARDDRSRFSRRRRRRRRPRDTDGGRAQAGSDLDDEMALIFARYLTEARLVELAAVVCCLRAGRAAFEALQDDKIPGVPTPTRRYGLQDDGSPACRRRLGATAFKTTAPRTSSRTRLRVSAGTPRSGARSSRAARWTCWA